jgi:SHS2 domain-containing protein
MAKHHETFDHTADIGLQARADSAEELFEALAECLCDVMIDTERVKPRDEYPIDVSAEDLEYLAVDFLWEILNLVQGERFLVNRIKVETISVTRVTAAVRGEPYDAQRHELRTEVKAVTQHQLAVAQEDSGGWVARVILDL